MVANTPKIVQILTWIGLNNNQKRNSVTSDVVSYTEVLSHIVTEDADGIGAICHNYQKRDITRESFTMTIIEVNRLKYFMYWVQDFHIFQENYDFPDVINQQKFLNEVDESLQQHFTRKNYADTGKHIITHKFSVPLKNHTK